MPARDQTSTATRGKRLVKWTGILLRPVASLRHVPLWCWGFILVMLSLVAALLQGFEPGGGILSRGIVRLLCYTSILGTFLGLVAAALNVEHRKAGLVVAGIGFTTVAAWGVIRLVQHLFTTPF